MYVFVLEWTPALTEALNNAVIDKTDNKNPPIPHGLLINNFNRLDLFLLILRIRFCKLHGRHDDGIEFFQNSL